MKAHDLISANETAIVILTDGDRFHIRSDGNGSTGNWVVSKHLVVSDIQKVIIYKRDTLHKTHEVYLAAPTDISESEEEGRRVIKLAGIRFIGTTNNHWNDFADLKIGARNPIRYIGR